MSTAEADRVLVVMAHPDDAEFACAGTVARWAREGREVIYVICTNGDKGSSDPNMTSERLARIREREQLQAAEALGVRHVVFLGYPDGGLEDTPQFRGQLVRLIRLYRPSTVITMEPYRFRGYVHHRDHRITGMVTMDAVFPYARDYLHYPEHIAEGLQPHKVRELYFTGADEPNTFVDISEVIDQKVAALRCHRSQIGDAPEEVFRERICAMAAVWSEAAGCPMAEAFRRLQLRV